MLYFFLPVEKRVHLTFVCTQQPFYNTIHYSMDLDIMWFKDGPQKYFETKMYRLYRKMIIYGHFSI